MKDSLRIALADDQALVRAGLRAVLEQHGFTVVLEAENGQQLLDLLDEPLPDIILSDIRMPVLDGFDLLRVLAERSNAPPVILLTTFDDEDATLTAASVGAKGFLLKDTRPDELAESIWKVHAGESLFQPMNLHAVRHHLQQSTNVETTPNFGAREIAILRLLAGGYSNKEIASILFLAEGTVKNYVSGILEKLGTRDRTRAVLKAIALRLI